MKDYRVEVKIRNNHLWQLMIRKRVYSARQCAIAMGNEHKQQCIGDLLNLRIGLYTKRGQVRSWVQDLADFFRVLPEDLVPPQHRDAPLKTNTGAFEASLEEVEQLSHTEHYTPLLERKISQEETRQALVDALENLTPSQKQAVIMRYSLDGDGERTFEEIGKRLGVSTERARQLEYAALRKLRATKNIRPVFEAATGRTDLHISDHWKEMRFDV